MEQTSLLRVQHLTVQCAGRAVLADVSFTVARGQILAVIGPSGSGKSSLIKALAGHHFGDSNIHFEKIKGHTPHTVSISQQHHFKNLSNTSAFYYQQRFNSFDAEDALMVGDVLGELCDDEALIASTLTLLGISYARATRLIQLSNGEHKRFQLAKAVLQRADWLLLDSPYTGLDIEARKLLNELIDALVAKGIQVLLVTSYTDLPKCVTHIAYLGDGTLKNIMPRKTFEKKTQIISGRQLLPSLDLRLIKEMVPAYAHEEFAVAIRMDCTSVTYNDRKILDNINWRVNKGECWSVSGHNGAGKSTLLSLITGDNPQAFANEIYLFDRKKGSGESIWDIKQKIGYVSPELHHYFEPGCRVFEVVASGLFDTIGLFRKLSERQISMVRNWMDLLQVSDFSGRMFSQLSNGEQRLVLLTRALVKNPPMLILDEPCQGLDADLSKWFIHLINDICVYLHKTLVYVSHYQEEIPPCVTYTLKLEKGKIAA